MINVLDFTKIVIEKNINKSGLYVDFTAGNGFDTLFISKLLANDGELFSFDISKIAIENTKKLLLSNDVDNINNIRLICDCHSKFDKYISGQIDGGIFNLGYLPNGDKSVTTKKDTTKKCLEKALLQLKEDGFLILVLYTGHVEGKLEAECIEGFCESLDRFQYNVMKYVPINKINPPYAIVITKLR